MVYVKGQAELEEYEKGVLAARDVQYNSSGPRSQYWRYGDKSILQMVWTKFLRLESAFARLDNLMKESGNLDAVCDMDTEFLEDCGDGRNYLLFAYEHYLERVKAREEGTG